MKGSRRPSAPALRPKIATRAHSRVSESLRACPLPHPAFQLGLHLAKVKRSQTLLHWQRLPSSFSATTKSPEAPSALTSAVASHPTTLPAAASSPCKATGQLAALPFALIRPSSAFSSQLVHLPSKPLQVHAAGALRLHRICIWA